MKLISIRTVVLTAGVLAFASLPQPSVAQDANRDTIMAQPMWAA
jgi:hypothetical protein